MGGFYLLLALFYGTLAYFTLKKGAQNNIFGLFALAIALALVTFAIPVQFGDQAWTTIIWTAEFAILMWLSIHTRMPLFRVFSYGAFVLMVVRLLVFDTTMDTRTFRPIFNERVITFIISITALYLVAYLLRRNRNVATEWVDPTRFLLVTANFLTVWLLSFELWNYFDTQIVNVPRNDVRFTALQSARNLSLTGLWTIYAVALLVVGITKRWRLVRLWGLSFLIVPIGKVFIYDVWALEAVYRIVAFVGLGLLLLTSGYLYQRYSKNITGFIVGH